MWGSDISCCSVFPIRRLLLSVGEGITYLRVRTESLPVFFGDSTKTLSLRIFQKQIVMPKLPHFEMLVALRHLRYFVAAITVLLTCPLATGFCQQPSLEVDEQRVQERLEMADDNREQLELAIESAPDDQKTAVKFLICNMPRKDLKSLSAEFLLENVRLAYEAKARAPWSEQVSDELFLNDVLPYAHVDETREAWRAKLHEICWPIVENCQTTGEAAQELNKHLFSTIQVKYSTKRKKANQSPSESMEQGLASCTGLSILLADACRSVNVPARLVGIPSWTNKRGNHTWVEVWDDGDWHFTGAAEYDAKGLDRAWFTNDAAKADKSKRLNSIYAVSFARTETTFPMVWSSDPENAVYAVNVTDRYTESSEPAEVDSTKILVRIRVWNADRSKRIPLKVTVDQADEDDAKKLSGTSPTDTSDMNDMLEFELKRGASYELHLEGDEVNQKHRIETANQETQLLDIVIDGKSKIDK